MVQNKKKFSSGNKKSIGQELEKKSQPAGAATERSNEAGRAGSTKQSDSSKSGMARKDVGSRK